VATDRALSVNNTYLLIYKLMTIPLETKDHLRAEMAEHHTCAVHDVIMNGLQVQIDSIEKGQGEVKDLIVQAHKESLSHLRATAEKNREDIIRLENKLDAELCKFISRDREYLMSLNTLKLETNRAIDAISAKQLALTAGGVAVAATISFLISFFRLAQPVLEIIPSMQ